MFSNVNEVVQNLHFAERGGYRFAIDWSRSCYRVPDTQEDPWSYYFEPCFPELSLSRSQIAALEPLPVGPSVACASDNIITPRLKDGVCDSLLLPTDRERPHVLIERHIRPKPHVLKHVDEYSALYFRRSVVGLHIRGPGRTDGGVPRLRAKHVDDNSVPTELYFARAEAELRRLGDADIFICSDSQAVIDAALARFGEHAIIYPASRSRFGEMHASHPANKGLEFDPARLGTDVLCEALLLCKTDVLVHGNSNIINFATCKNLDLPHIDVYGGK